MSIDILLSLFRVKRDNKYVFINGNPIDMRNRKYGRWLRLYQAGKLKCKCCGVKPDRIEIVRCKGHGKWHESGKHKHHLKLFAGKDEMTFDHWVPKSFLRKKTNLCYRAESNLVLMCESCNRIKADLVPYHWQKQYAIMATERI